MIKISSLLVAALTATASLGTAGGDVSAETSLRCPSGLALVGNHLYFSESGGQSVRRLALDTGDVAVVAGSGEQGFGGDGGPAAEARLDGPMGLALTPDGGLMIADVGNQRVRRVDLRSGTMDTVAGGGEGNDIGDGGPALGAKLHGPYDVAMTGDGDLLIADTNHHRIRRVDRETGVITTVAGTGESDFGGDGGPATEAHLRRPHVVAVDGLGRLVIGDSFNLRIRRVDREGVITSIAGNGEVASAGDGGPAHKASFVFFGAIRHSAAGDLLVTEFGANRVRRIDGRTDIVSTVAGDGEESWAGDGGAATKASLASPLGLAIDNAGNLFIADCGNNRIRRIDAETGVIETLLGGSPTP